MVRAEMRGPAREDAPEKRLLLLTPDFPPAHGGIQVMAHRLATHIEGFATSVLTLDADGGRTFDAAGGLDVRRAAASAGRPRAARIALLNAAALAAARRLRPDVTLSLHSVTSPGAVAVRGLCGAPFVQVFHAKEIPPRPRLARFAAERADAVIAVSAYCEELIAATGAHPREMRRIPGGVDLPDEASPLPAERPTIVTISRLEDRHKGHDVMIEALPLVLAEVSAAEWIVIGDGVLRGELEARVSAAGLGDAVRFLGRLPDSERDRWLRRASVFAMPSRLPGPGHAGEGFGIAFMEAASYGKPVVAGAEGGALDSVQDGITGLLVDPRDPAAIAAAIVSVLRDGALAARLGAAGAARARGFSWAEQARRVQELLCETATRGGRRA